MCVFAEYWLIYRVSLLVQFDAFLLILFSTWTPNLYLFLGLPLRYPSYKIHIVELGLFRDLNWRMCHNIFEQYCDIVIIVWQNFMSDIVFFDVFIKNQQWYRSITLYASFLFQIYNTMHFVQSSSFHLPLNLLLFVHICVQCLVYMCCSLLCFYLP